MILHHSLFIDATKITIIFIGSCYLLFVSFMTIVFYSIQKIQALEPWLLAPREYYVLMISPSQSLRILLISSTAAVNSSLCPNESALTWLWQTPIVQSSTFLSSGLSLKTWDPTQLQSKPKSSPEVWESHLLQE